jgi:hypothetical protein
VLKEPIARYYCGNRGFLFYNFIMAPQSERSIKLAVALDRNGKESHGPSQLIGADERT